MFFFKLYHKAEEEERKIEFCMNVLLLNGEFYIPAIDISKSARYPNFQKFVRGSTTVLFRDLVNVDPAMSNIANRCVMLSLPQVLSAAQVAYSDYWDCGHIKQFKTWINEVSTGFLSVIYGDINSALDSTYMSLVNTPVFMCDKKGGWSLNMLKELCGMTTQETDLDNLNPPNPVETIGLVRCYNCMHWNQYTV